MILPIFPFSSVPPILVGGGPGTWLLMGYVLYLVAGFGGLAGLAALAHDEEAELGRLAGWTMALGLTLYYGGMTASCALLGIAGYFGGYGYSIQHLSDPSIQSILLPYFDPTTLAALVACAGAALLLAGLVSSSRILRPRDER